MIRFYDCVVNQHEYWLVGLAALVCLLGSTAAVNLLHHVNMVLRSGRVLWLAVTALASGSAIWATHFIAMLAFKPGVQTGYSVNLTVLSFLAAVALTGVAFGYTMQQPTKANRAIGGAMVGGGIAAMHYTGMAAFEASGTISWDATLVVVSVMLGALFGALALVFGLRSNSLQAKMTGATLLTLAIVSHHFTAMAAAEIVPDPRIVVSPSSMPPSIMAAVVAGVSLTILALSLLGMHFHLRDARQKEAEASHMRDLADAAVEGLVVIDGDEIVAANKSFEAMVGVGRLTLSTMQIGDLLNDNGTFRILRDGHGVEGEIRSSSGENIPVEMVTRRITYAGKPHKAVAFRDLRSRRKAEEEIRFLAHNDPLTKIPNRVSFNDRIERAFDYYRMARRPFAVLALDLDRFKPVNDMLGHSLGDALLVKASERIKSALREEDLVARIGGDEFAVLQTSGTQPGAATALASRIVELLSAPFVIDGHAVNIGASIGIAIAPQDGDDARRLMNNADLALYRAKNEGRGTHRFFEPDMDARMQERRSLELDMHQAIRRGEFEIHYQPQLSLKDDRIVGFEALLRWHHPSRGTIAPAQFIPLAEETGLIVPIGEWVLRTACRDAMNWPRHFSVAVNLSPVQFRSQKLVETVAACLDASGLDPARLELEITESVLLHDNSATLSTLHALRSLGIKISMDDFGTGYSSLSYLRSFPFDRIKIDQSFVREVANNDECSAIIRAIISLGRSLGIATTAEGVETEAQRDCIAAEGCDQIQGYLIGRPLPLAEIGKFFRDSQVA